MVHVYQKVTDVIKHSTVLIDLMRRTAHLKVSYAFKIFTYIYLFMYSSIYSFFQICMLVISEGESGNEKGYFFGKKILLTPVDCYSSWLLFVSATEKSCNYF